MKRKIVSVLLALVLTLALLPAGVLADGETQTELTQDVINTYYVEGWEEYRLSEGNYILKQDLTLDGYISIGRATRNANVTLDLNGFKLTSAPKRSCTLFVDSGSTLTLRDNSTGGNGAIVSPNHKAVIVFDGAAFILESGNIRGGEFGVVVNGDYDAATFTMNGGSVTGGIFLEAPSILYANGGTVNGTSELKGTVNDNGTVFQMAGKGTKDEPLELKTADHLKAFRDLVNKGYFGVCAKLTDDIVLDGSEAWTPIMPIIFEHEGNYFGYYGTFDGGGHTISGLNVTGNFAYAGLFGVVTHNGTIKNLTVAGNVSTDSHGGAVGGIVGYALDAAIVNCSNHCSVTGRSSEVVAGIAGFSVEGTKIVDCYNLGTITINYCDHTGGIAGYNNGMISNCYTVKDSIVCDNFGTVENCYYLNTANNEAVENNHGSGTVTKTDSKTAEEFANGTVLKLLKNGTRTGEDPWDSKCRLVEAAKMTLPVFKYQAPEEPTPEPVSEPSGSRFSYSTISASAGENGKISPSGDVSVRDGSSQTFAFTPDKGYRVKDVLIDGKSVGALRSYTFATVRKNRTVEVLFEKIPAFVDVPAGSYYEDAVNWAVENWITEGTSDTRFSPDAPCTRGQAVTFLWRAAGCPAPGSYTMPFADVKSDSYYYNAVLWALENNIVSGTSETTFEPDAVCTRAQIVCFLFRYKAANGMDAVTLAELLGGYADSAEIPAYARPALNWAIAASVLQGSGAKLLPNEACTRAQIVTLLYRAIR